MAVIAILCLAAAAQITRLAHPPRWFDHSLAGYAFAYDNKHEPVAVMDPNTHYMLVREVECDGGDLCLLLTRDRYEVENMGFRVPGFKGKQTDADEDTGEAKFQVKPLPSLKTGKGIEIGDSPVSVRTRLGKPSKVSSTGTRKQFVNYEYAFQVGRAEESLRYEQTYVFKANKLIEVMFTWGPGEGYADMAIVIPKAKKTVNDPHRGDGP